MILLKDLLCLPQTLDWPDRMQHLQQVLRTWFPRGNNWFGHSIFITDIWIMVNGLFSAISEGESGWWVGSVYYV